MFQTRNGYLRSEGKAAFLFSEVAQRYLGDEKSSADQLRWLNSFQADDQRLDHSCISPLTGMFPTQTFTNFFLK